uniref:Occludin/ELL domain containing 1 n=1 Tax=Cricetulus griseus TaxID=10029 RepID=A0A8C2QJR8_CRIGR
MQIPSSPAPRRGPPRSRSSGHNATYSSRPAAGGRPNAAAPRMPTRAPESRARGPQCQPGPGELRTRPRKIVFADELGARAPGPGQKPSKALGPRPSPVPDYELRRLTWQLGSGESLRRSGR